MGNRQTAVNPKALTMKQLSISGSFVGSKDELQLIVDLARVEKLKGVVNTKYRLEQVNYALTALNQGTIVGRGYFDPLL